MPKVVPQYKEEAKERIIQAALQVYAEKGLYEATMDDVARKLGVSKGALYLYFKSKEELLNQIIKRPEQSVYHFLESLLETKNLNESLEDAFEHDKYNPSEKRRSLLFDFIAEASRNPSIRRAVSETYEQNVKTLASFLANQNPNLKRKPEESRCQAVSLISLYLGTLASSILGADNDDLKQAFQQSIKVIALSKIG